MLLLHSHATLVTEELDLEEGLVNWQNIQQNGTHKLQDVVIKHCFISKKLNTSYYVKIV